MIRPPPISTLFPYTTLFRSVPVIVVITNIPRSVLIRRFKSRRVEKVFRRPQIISRSEEHTSELQSLRHLVCRLLLEKKKTEHDSCLRAHARVLADSTHTAKA